jgi:hypothetical protein
MESSPKFTSFASIVAIGTLAIGATVGISAAPAHAVLLNNGDLTFGSSNIPGFITDVTPGVPVSPPDTISISFGSTTTVGSANGSLANSPFFTPASLATSGVFTGAAPTALFTYVSGNNSNFVYSLTGNTDFNFTNGVTLSVANGTLFGGSRNANAVTFSTIAETGSFFRNGTDVAPLNALSFGLNDISGSGLGTYGITASTQPIRTTSVPEPFTIVGTIIGASAAMRMRKKMSDATKD